MRARPTCHGTCARGLIIPVRVGRGGISIIGALHTTSTSAAHAFAEAAAAVAAAADDDDESIGLVR